MNDCFHIIAVGVPVIKTLDFSYTGALTMWEVCIVFKKAKGPMGEVTFKVRRGADIVAVAELNLTTQECVMKLAFRCRNASKLKLEVTNWTDTSDILITHKSLSPYGVGGGS